MLDNKSDSSFHMLSLSIETLRFPLILCIHKVPVSLCTQQGGSVHAFTPDYHIISYDGMHLTRDGVDHYAALLAYHTSLHIVFRH